MGSRFSCAAHARTDRHAWASARALASGEVRARSRGGRGRTRQMTLLAEVPQALRHQRFDVGDDALADVAARPALAMRPAPHRRIAHADSIEVEPVALLVVP